MATRAQLLWSVSAPPNGVGPLNPADATTVGTQFDTLFGVGGNADQAMLNNLHGALAAAAPAGSPIANALAAGGPLAAFNNAGMQAAYVAAGAPGFVAPPPGPPAAPAIPWYKKHWKWLAGAGAVLAVLIGGGLLYKGCANNGTSPTNSSPSAVPAPTTPPPATTTAAPAPTTPVPVPLPFGGWTPPPGWVPGTPLPPGYPPPPSFPSAVPSLPPGWVPGMPIPSGWIPTSPALVFPTGWPTPPGWTPGMPLPPGWPLPPGVPTAIPYPTTSPTGTTAPPPASSGTSITVIVAPSWPGGAAPSGSSSAQPGVPTPAWPFANPTEVGPNGIKFTK